MENKTASISRRSFVFGGAALLGSIALAGCSPATQSQQSSSQGQSSSSASQEQPATQPQSAAPATANNTLVVYFSRAGMNYTTSGPVDTPIGNTAVVAGFVKEALNCDSYEIVAADPYPYEYDATTNQAQQEKSQNARPAIAGALPDLTPYDTILVGSGIWWGDPPMIMHTFFEQVDTAGKTIIPFTTHAGSGLGTAASTYRELCPQATIDEAGLAVLGQNAADSQSEVAAWLNEKGLTN